MVKQGLVSIIVPVYNSGKTIESTINSILNQTYKNIEILVINDCSTDSTCSIVLGLQKKDKRIKLISQKHKGIAETFNTGLKNVNGEYFLIIGSDDNLSSDAIQNLVTYLEKNKTKFAVFGLTKYFFSGKNRTYDVRGKMKPGFNSFDLANKFLTCTKAPFTPASLLYKADVIKEIGYFNENLERSVDSDYTYRLLSTLKVGAISKIVYNYDISSHGTKGKIKFMYLQLKSKLKVINLHKTGLSRFWLLFSNISYFPIKVFITYSTYFYIEIKSHFNLGHR